MKFSDKTKEKLDKKLTKLETKGFNFANRMHRFAINATMLFIGYQLYTFLREYNDFFLNARKVKKMEQFEDGPINRDQNDDY